MFKIQHKRHCGDIRTVYAADFATQKFLVTTSWGEFEWVYIEDYWVYEEEE